MSNQPPATDAVIEMIDQLHQEIKRLRVELEVRTKMYEAVSRETPEPFKAQRARAYHHGFELGWRNQRLGQTPYTSDAHNRAYMAGYRAGEAKSLEEIGRLL